MGEVASCSDGDVSDVNDARSEGTAPDAAQSSAGLRVGSQVTRAVNRDSRIRERFDLPEHEELIKEFRCAYYDGILRQGHLYVMKEHVCFHAHVFGLDRFVTRWKHHLGDIKDVRKARNVGIPNSIVITTTDGKEHFFTSFLIRTPCYDLIAENLRTYKMLHRNGLERETVVPRNSPPVDEEPNLVPGDNLLSPSAAAAPRATGSGDEGEAWPIEGDEPPPGEGWTPFPGEGWTEVLDMKCSGRSVLDLLKIFDEGDTMLKEWHDLLGDTKVVYGPWKRVPDLGQARDVSFTAKLIPARNLPFQPSTANCQQSQRGMRYRHGAFTFQIEQTMPDAPIIGNILTVHIRWLATPTGGTDTPAFRLRSAMKLQFRSRPPLIVPVNAVKSQTIAQTQHAYSELRKLLLSRFDVAQPPAAAPELSVAELRMQRVQEECEHAARRMPAAWRPPSGAAPPAKPQTMGRPPKQRHLFEGMLTLHHCALFVVAVMAAAAIMRMLDARHFSVSAATSASENEGLLMAISTSVAATLHEVAGSVPSYFGRVATELNTGSPLNSLPPDVVSNASRCISEKASSFLSEAGPSHAAKHAAALGAAVACKVDEQLAQSGAASPGRGGRSRSFDRSGEGSGAEGTARQAQQTRHREPRGSEYASKLEASQREAVLAEIAALRVLLEAATRRLSQADGVT